MGHSLESIWPHFVTKGMMNTYGLETNQTETSCTVGVRPNLVLSKSSNVEEWLFRQSPALVITVAALWMLYREFKTLQKNQIEIISQNGEVINKNSLALASLTDIIGDGMERSKDATAEIKNQIADIQNRLVSMKTDQDRLIGTVETLMSIKRDNDNDAGGESD